MLKIESRSVMVTLSTQVTVGELDCKCIIQCFVNFDENGKKNIDSDFTDINNITYMGVPIEGYENWKRFRAFHDEMGINFDDAISKIVNERTTDEKLQALLTYIN